MVAALAAWAGATVLLGEVAWFRRRPLLERLRPYGPGGAGATTASAALSVASVRDVIGPLAHELGARLTRLAGGADDLDARLARVHAPMGAAAFRLRQVGWALVGLGGGVVAALGLRPPAAIAGLFVAGAPLLAVLAVEQSATSASRSWQRRTTLELPVVAEQLGMLLAAGYSLGGALNRLGARGKGACGTDLGLVVHRIRQGLDDVDALREWSDRVDVDPLHRLVALLALNHEAGDLGRLVSDEARSLRSDVQRRRVEMIDRRAQQVWVPVTVAALVPGVLFLAVPFLEALRLYGGR